jgi:tetratricopeptide (TPR) repeat protein
MKQGLGEIFTVLVLGTAALPIAEFRDGHPQTDDGFSRSKLETINTNLNASNMKKNTLFFLTAITFLPGMALAQNPINPTVAPLVLQLPGMDKVIVQKDVAYKNLKDTTLTFDIYYPPGFDKKSVLPLVIFNNGVGGNEVPTWRVYQDWAKLVALHGMIAVNHQSRRGKTLKDSEDLVDYLQLHAGELKVDRNSFGLWACSGNVGAGMPLAMQQNRRYIRALVMYYGAGWRPEDNTIKRQDLEIQVVRAGLDFYNLNKSLESFMVNALKTDAHVQFINYPEGQHAFDVLDDTPRTKTIIQQTLDFFKQKLSNTYPANEGFVLTNVLLWNMVMEEKRTDEAVAEFKKAISKYSKMPNHSPWYNHVFDERNLNQMGYQLLGVNRMDEAIKIFKANQEAFPDSPNVYDGLGDAYEKAGDKEKAIANSKLALEKLGKAANIQPQMKEAIRTSAEAKLKRLQ